MTITTRTGKGSELTYGELDGNFTDLNTRTIVGGWRDLVMGIDVKPAGIVPTLQNFRDGIYLWGFDPDTNQEAYAQGHIDHDYQLGSALYPHVHFAVNVTNTGTVRWGIEYTLAKGHQQMAFGPTNTLYVEMAITGTQYMHYIAEVNLANVIPGTNIEPDTMILFRFFRDASHVNDTFPGTAYFLTADIHYQVDRYATVNKAPNFYGS